MSTIALYANQINQMPTFIKGVRASVLDYQSELSALNAQVLTINPSVCNIDDVINLIQASTQTQEQKVASIDALDKSNEDFVATVIAIDTRAEEAVKQRQEEFESSYTYSDSESEKNFFKKMFDWLASADEWCKEQWFYLISKALAGITISIIANWLKDLDTSSPGKGLQPDASDDLEPPRLHEGTNGIFNKETLRDKLQHHQYEFFFSPKSREEYNGPDEEVEQENIGEQTNSLNAMIELKLLEITETDVIVGQNQKSIDAMFERSLPEVLTRMIYQENHNCENGEQSKVLWVVVNRIFSDGNFTYGRKQTLHNVLYYGGYESLTTNNSNGTYNAFHPDYESDGWENAKLLAATLCAIIGDNEKADLDEDYVRETLESLQDIMGNNIINEIGDCDSFWGDGKENHFYIYSKGK